MSGHRQAPFPRWSALLALILASISSIAIVLWLAWPRMAVIDPSATVSTGQPSFLPWTVHQPVTRQPIVITATLTPLSLRTWRVIPDDELLSLTVNGQPVSLDAIPKSALTDWNKGFEMDFSPWLHGGQNTLEFVITNHGGDGGLMLHPALGPGWMLIYLGFMPWLYTLGRIFRLRRHQIAPIGAGLMLIMAYWSVTPWTVRAHDVIGSDGHLAYIARVAETHTLPAPTETWELLQAPLYYMGGALVWKLAGIAGLPIPVCLQAYSLSLWMIFLCASSAAMRLALRFRTAATTLATTALAMWPSGIIHGIRISNDVGLYAVAALATLYLLKWWHRNRRRDLLIMSLFVSLGLVTKSNAIVLFAAGSLLMLLRVMRRQRWRNPDILKPYLGAWLIMCIGAALYLGRNILYYWRGAIPDWLNGSSAIHLGEWLKVPANLTSFVKLEPITFLGSPWLVLTEDATGRSLFWNALLRSSLTGEFQFNGSLQRSVAYLWGSMLLALMLALTWTLVRQMRTPHPARGGWRNLPWLLLSGLWLASLMALRFHVPYACSNDFRFVLPILVPFMVWACSRVLSAAALSLLALGSMLFFLTLPYG